MQSTSAFESADEHERQRDHVVVAPDGNRLVIPKELFDALWELLRRDKSTGSLAVHFRNGGVAGLEASIKKVYK